MRTPEAGDRDWLFSGIPAPILRVQFAVLCMTSGMGMVYSILVLDAKSLGVGAFLAGTLVAAFGGIRFLANVPIGIASERFGRRMTAISGLGLAAAGSVMAAFVTGFASLFMCVLLQGLGIGVFNTATLSAIADLGTPQTRVRDMAAYQGAFLCGLSIGPALGGFAAERWGYGGPFILQAALAVCALAIMHGAADVQGKQSVKFDLSTLVSLAGPASLTYSVIFARAVSVWILLPLIAQRDLHMSVATIGLVLAVGSISNLAVLPIAAPLAWRFGRVPVIVCAGTTICAALVLLSLKPSAESLWVASFLFGAGIGVALPVSVACAADIAPAGQTGASMGLMRAMTDVGLLTAPLIFGAAMDRLPNGLDDGIAICVALLIAAIAFFAFKSKPTQRLLPASMQPEAAPSNDMRSPIVAENGLLNTFASRGHET